MEIKNRPPDQIKWSVMSSLFCNVVIIKSTKGGNRTCLCRQAGPHIRRYTTCLPSRWPKQGRQACLPSRLAEVGRQVLSRARLPVPNEKRCTGHLLMRLFRNSLPTPLFKYFSRALASGLDGNVSTQISSKGRYGLVVLFDPLLCWKIRWFRS